MAMVMTLKVVNCYDGDGGDGGPSGDMMDPSSLQKYSCPTL